MAKPALWRGPRPGRLLGLYALSVMGRDGPIYGYLLADRISDRTDGAWRPGAGAIYPALQSLVTKGFARVTRDGRRRLYSATPQGRAFLRRVRRGWMGGARAGPELGLLWSEIAGDGDPGQHLLRHLRHHLEGIVAYLDRDPRMLAGSGSLRDQVLAELRVTEARLAALAVARPGPRRTSTQKSP
ncbi:MAG: PadR family transcriptional regulator [Thermoplasmata archaeon]